MSKTLTKKRKTRGKSALLCSPLLLLCVFTFYPAPFNFSLLHYREDTLCVKRVKTRESRRQVNDFDDFDDDTNDDDVIIIFSRSGRSFLPRWTTTRRGDRALQHKIAVSRCVTVDD